MYLWIVYLRFFKKCVKAYNFGYFSSETPAFTGPENRLSVLFSGSFGGKILHHLHVDTSKFLSNANFFRKTVAIAALFFCSELSVAQQSSTNEVKYKVAPITIPASEAGQKEIKEKEKHPEKKLKKEHLQDAGSGSYESEAKEHFLLQLNENASGKKELYTKALHQFPRMDAYRKTQERVRIPLGSTDGFVILWSANELKERYGRPIRPLNQKADLNNARVRFELNSCGQLKEALIE